MGRDLRARQLVPRPFPAASGKSTTVEGKTVVKKRFFS
jgi:hypothetical protein